MNLREDIERIKEVMGINESRDMYFKRRQNEFLDVLLTSYEWMDEFIDEMDSFEDYLKLILRHSIDGFFEFNNILVRGDEIEELLPYALLSLRNDERLFRKIKDHYYSNKSSARYTESVNESDVHGINEIRDLFLRRRRKEFIDAILQSYEWIDVGEAGSFQEYLEEVLMHAIDGLFDYNNLLVRHDEMTELLPKALRILQDDEWLFKKIKYHYYSAEDSSMNESKSSLLI